MDSSNAATETAFSNLYTYPGKAFTFAVKVEGQTAASLSITKLISNDSVMDGIVDDRAEGAQAQNRYIYDGNDQVDDILINVGWAIDIFSQGFTPVHGSYPNPASYASAVNNPGANMGTGATRDARDQFKYDETSNNANYHRDTYLAGEMNDTTKVVTLDNPIEIYSDTSLSTSNDLFIFYSVVFSNETSTRYIEVDDSNNPIKTKPVSGSRYFRQDDDGDSNCYAKLKFALTELYLEL